MTHLENRLRALADAPMPGPLGPADLRRRSRRRSSRRRAMAVAVPLVVAGVVAAAVVAATRGGENQQVNAGPGREETTPTEPSINATTSVAPGAAQTPVLAVTSDETVIRKAPGEEPVTLFRAPPDTFVRDVAPGRTDDESVITTRQDRADCDGNIQWLSDSGQLSDPIGRGGNLSMSPDRSRLAYVELGSTDPGGDDCRGAALIVLDVESGERHTWSARQMSLPYVNDFGILTSLQWSPDGRKLAFGTYDGHLNILDVSQDGDSVADGLRLRSDRPGIQHPFWDVETGELYVVDTAGGPEHYTSPLVTIDPTDGRTLRTVMKNVGPGRAIVGVGEGRDSFVALAYSVVVEDVEDDDSSYQEYRNGQWFQSDLDNLRFLTPSPATP